jgi:DNA-binding MltR family transcriptional regulator
MNTNNEEQQLLNSIKKFSDKLQKIEELHKKVLTYAKQFLCESDRASILLTAAMIDYRLKELLGKYFVPPNGNDDILSEKGANPLSTFSSRHKIAYRSGLISSELEKSISDIREIRNYCAHEIEQIDFEDRSKPINQSIRGKIANIVGRFEGMREIFEQLEIKERKQFLLASSWIIMKLDQLIFEITPCIEATTENIFKSELMSKWGKKLESP